MAGLWHDLLEEVDRRIARALARVGVTGSTIDAGQLGGALPTIVAGTVDHGGLTGLGDDDHTQYQKESEKDQNNGYAGLNSSGLVPEARIDAAIARDSEVTAAVAAHAAAADPHTGYQKESEKGGASGYASLDGSAKVPIAELPTGTTSSTVSLGDHAHSGSASLTQLHEHAIGEDLTAETDGVKVTFITANEFEPETVAVYLLGARLRPGTDYTEDAGCQSITFGAAPSAADELILDYVAA